MFFEQHSCLARKSVFTTLIYIYIFVPILFYSFNLNSKVICDLLMDLAGKYIDTIVYYYTLLVCM